MSEKTDTTATATATETDLVIPIGAGEIGELPEGVPPFVRQMIELTNLYAGLEADAQRVLMRIARRLKDGQAQYGKLDLATDTRNLIDEAVQEAADKAVYLVCEAERLLILQEKAESA